MTTTPKSPATENKQLTPAQIQRRKKMVVFPLLFLLFAGSIWLIFAPSSGAEDEHTEGFNTELPDPNKRGIVTDKVDAYVQEAMDNKRNQNMRTLHDYAFSLGDREETEEERMAREQRQIAMAPKPAEFYENPAMFTKTSNTGSNAFQTSATAYQDVNRHLGSFYQQTSNADSDPRQKELLERIDELERRLEQAAAQRDAEDETLSLIEKSYQIAARYMGGAPDNPAPVTEPVQTAQYHNGKVVAEPVGQVRREVVSRLVSPNSADEFIDEADKPRNWNFNTVAGDEDTSDKNSIRATIYQTVTITDGQQVQLRLSEPMMAGYTYIPENTILTGFARLSGERLSITIEAIHYAGNVVPVELIVHDLDGVQGISVPGSEEISAVKEIAAGMGSGMGSSITITDDAGSQLLADLGRSAIQGTSQYISKKMRTVKVTLKAGYRVLLLPPLK